MYRRSVMGCCVSFGETNIYGERHAVTKRWIDFAKASKTRVQQVWDERFVDRNVGTELRIKLKPGLMSDSKVVSKRG